MNRRPITRQRSVWTERPGFDLGIPGARWYMRNVHDGALVAIVAEEPGGWHLSISHRPNGGAALRRYPTWDEIADARDVLLPGDRGFVMHLPRAAEYVALHDTTFHLHEHPERAS